MSETDSKKTQVETRDLPQEKSGELSEAQLAKVAGGGFWSTLKSILSTGGLGDRGDTESGNDSGVTSKSV